MVEQASGKALMPQVASKPNGGASKWQSFDAEVLNDIPTSQHRPYSVPCKLCLASLENYFSIRVTLAHVFL
jgi:hypothetical protein